MGSRRSAGGQHPKRSAAPSSGPPKGVAIRRRAVRDLEGIAEYTLDRWGDAQLVEYMTALDRAFQLLLEDQSLGKPADDVRQGYFRHHVGRHVIYFKRRRSGVEIVRVLHDRMSPRRHL